MNLVKIGLVFENCEDVEYHHGKDFTFFDIGDVKERFSNFCNACSKDKVVEGFSLILTKDADVSRLGKDVTQLSLEYQDGSKEHLLVMWPEDGNEFYHSGQKKVVTEVKNVLFTSECGSYTVPEMFEGEDSIDAWCW